LGNRFNVISLEDQLIFLGWRVDNSDPLHHLYFPDELFTQEVTDLNDGVVLRCDTINGEMGIDCSHFVLKSL
jgi:hypothetical protein